MSDRGIGFVVVNAENAAGGSGLTETIYEKILRCGVDVITMGDHIYRRREIIQILETSDRIVRPANMPSGAPGKEVVISESASNHRVAVISVLGRMYMKTPFDCPFRAVDRILASLPQDVKLIVVDLHAEATSEKIAMGWHLDGRVTALVGTHTHVPTADERVLPKGTAYITDLGMTGPYDSVLGRDRKRVVSAMVSGVPNRFDVATDDPRMCGLLITCDTTTGRASAVERIRFNGTTES